MRIFSNFDTKIRTKAVDEQIVRYGRENVICFGRSRLYWALKIFLPMVFLIAFWLGIIALFYYVFDSEYLLFFCIAIGVLSLFFFVPIIGKWIDYELDFIIVTPDFLMMYDQAWIFKKKVITVNEKSIKTISVERSGLLYSLFNNWDIIVLSEWDMVHWEITLKWIPRPEKRKKQISKIFNKDWV
jgi:hypothetical protein